jgi:hypothetical protein
MLSNGLIEANAAEKEKQLMINKILNWTMSVIVICVCVNEIYPNLHKVKQACCKKKCKSKKKQASEVEASSDPV